jgi:outer membrane biosynthesis protein TonB
MTKRLAVLPLLFVLAACSQEPAAVATETIDTREPVEILFVTAPEAPVHAKPDQAAAVVSTYQNGESVSVLAKQADWSEIRTGAGSGWVRAEYLGTQQEKEEAEENPQPKFLVMPLPVTAPGAHGEIYLEADVNTDGDVLSIRTITNTTGSPALAAQNTQALRTAKFYPIVLKGERKPFKYYHRVTY